MQFSAYFVDRLNFVYNHELTLELGYSALKSALYPCPMEMNSLHMAHDMNHLQK